MLKGIPDILYGQALAVLRDMGHGDELIIADGNFSSAADSHHRPPVMFAGCAALQVVDAVLEVMPLDDVSFGPPAAFITPDDAKAYYSNPAVDNFRILVRGFTEEVPDYKLFKPIRRKDFHAAAQKAYAIFATCDRAHYACFRLRKGSLSEPAEDLIPDVEDARVRNRLIIDPDTLGNPVPQPEPVWLTRAHLAGFARDHGFTEQAVSFVWNRICDKSRRSEQMHNGLPIMGQFETGDSACRHTKLEKNSLIAAFRGDESSASPEHFVAGWGKKCTQLMAAWLDHLTSQPD